MTATVLAALPLLAVVLAPPAVEAHPLPVVVPPLLAAPNAAVPPTTNLVTLGTVAAIATATVKAEGTTGGSTKGNGTMREGGAGVRLEGAVGARGGEIAGRGMREI